jgi:hypothetical protein
MHKRTKCVPATPQHSDSDMILRDLVYHCLESSPRARLEVMLKVLIRSADRSVLDAVRVEATAAGVWRDEFSVQCDRSCCARLDCMPMIAAVGASSPLQVHDRQTIVYLLSFCDGSTLAMLSSTCRFFNRSGVGGMIPQAVCAAKRTPGRLSPTLPSWCMLLHQVRMS